jgi:carboxyl-terminal processing protease
MKRARSTLKTSPLRTMILATCCFTAPGLALAQDQDAQTQQILDSIQSGERVELKLPDPEEQLPLEDLRKFTEVFSRIKDAYVEDVSDTQLLESAIKGMLSDLDPHSTYRPPRITRNWKKVPPGNLAALALKWAWRTALSKSSLPSTTPRPRKRAFKLAT